MKYIGDILYDEDLIRGENRFVIFGAGKYGRKILQYLENNNVKKSIVCFCDSNIQLERQNINGIPIIGVMDAITRYPEAEYLVAGKYSREMYRLLKDKLVKKIHLLFI